MQVTPAEPPRPLRPPRVNGRYVVTRLLGKGAQARVYLAMDARLRQWRALKVLAPEYVHDEQVRHRFQKEAEAMARLSHRNLLRILDIDTDGELPFIVMELARSGAVTDWLKRHGVMTPQLAIEVIGQACAGLAHAHGQNIVHRDVKPHNLLIADDCRILLTDFGIAQLDEDVSVTQTGSVLGTFAYMAPEQRNDTKSVDQRTDVYALGATLYTCLTLRTSAELFFAENRDEILEGLPKELALVILDACRYDREDRIQTVLALKDRLDACRGAFPEVEAPPLNSQILPLPEKAPRELDPESGVEELARLLSTPSLDRGGHVPRSRAEMLFEEQSTTLYSDTGYDEDDDVFAFADEAEPSSVDTLRPEASDPGVTQPSEVPEGVWDERLEAEAMTDVSGDASASSERTQTTQTFGFRRAVSLDSGVRRSFAELSEEDAPSYVDVSTLDRPSPAIDPPREPGPGLRLSAPEHRRSPVVPPVLHTAEPASVRRERATGGDRAPLSLYIGTALLFVVTMVVSFSVLDKAYTSYQANGAGIQLVEKLRDARDPILRELGKRGDTDDLERMWFEFEDAKPADKVEQANRFGRAIVERADGQPLETLVRAQVEHLRAALEARERAKRRADEVQASILGRITGPLGTFAY